MDEITETEGLASNPNMEWERRQNLFRWKGENMAKKAGDHFKKAGCSALWIAAEKLSIENNILDFEHGSHCWFYKSSLGGVLQAKIQLKFLKNKLELWLKASNTFSQLFCKITF